MSSPDDDQMTFTDSDAATIITLWFGDYRLSSPGSASPDAVRRWFLGDPDFKRTCAVLTPLLTLLSSTAFTPETIVDLATNPTRALALIVLLGPLPRILYPADPRIYTCFDPLALALARYSLAPERRWDLGVDGEWRRSPTVRMWFLLPGGNSEELEIQEETGRAAEEVVRDVGEVVDGVWDGARVSEAMNMARFLKETEEEVRTWGRIRDRDAVLGRAPLPEGVEL